MRMSNDASQLPIRQYESEIATLIETNPIVVIIGETGSGKTTQIAQIIYDCVIQSKQNEQHTVIGVTQPRRVAAVSVAKRVAQERNVTLGEEVGYAVRFEDRTDPTKTRIKYLTDGTLLKELLQDPLLSRYSVIILDEAHERSLNTDILFGLLKTLALSPSGRLKLVITSATLDTEKFSTYFNNCPVFTIPGRTHPVKIIHSLEDHTNEYVNAAIDTAVDIHCRYPPDSGDILIFLTGQAEIDKAVKSLNEAIQGLPEGSCGDLLVLPLYAALPPDVQWRVFQKQQQPVPTTSDTTRRCIIATNIAETSVTVVGVVYVIDSGVVKIQQYNARTGMNHLIVTPISKVQATQRAGRAGRTRPGVCFRLYTKLTYESDLPPTHPPEIQRTSLVSTVLYLKSLQLTPPIDVLRFEYMDAPKPEALQDALTQLYVLEAIDVDGQVTAVGRDMAALPVDPSLARALLAAAEEYGCVDDMMVVAAMLSSTHDGGTSVFVSRSDGTDVNDIKEEVSSDGLGDAVMLLRLYRRWEQEVGKWSNRGEGGGAGGRWCRQMGVDVRVMRFADDVVRQLRVLGSNFGLRRKECDSSDDAQRKKQKTCSSSRYTSLRKALTIGFANRIARRMQLHNGYRTLSVPHQAPTLAQIHPNAAPLKVNEFSGLLPEWILYHELISTAGSGGGGSGRTYLSGVVAIEGRWVEDSGVLDKLRNPIDVQRLSGGGAGDAGKGTEGNNEPVAAAAAATAANKRLDAQAIDAARARYLARKAAKRQHTS